MSENEVRQMVADLLDGNIHDATNGFDRIMQSKIEKKLGMEDSEEEESK